MKGVEDFRLHEHPLIYNDDQQEDWCCSACGLPLLLSPSYRCNNDCNFFLHKACKQLPQDLNYVARRNGASYSLSLDVKPPNEAWTCDVCGELCKNLIAYRSTEWLDKNDKLEHMIGIVYVDVLCAPVPLEIKSKHDGHEHELIAMRREALLHCDVCERPHKGFFFSCNSCVFWIHKDCTVLPRVIETIFHKHPLVFSYSYFGAVVQTTQKNFKRCEVCSKKFSATAAYYCLQLLCRSRSIVHSNCAISKIKENSGYDLPFQFPLEEADKSLFIYEMLDKKRIVEKNNDEDEKSSIEKYHNHPLIFRDIVDKDSSSNSLCDACILPVNSPPYYSCENRECDFLLHQHCTNLPYKINPTRQFTLKIKADELLASLWACSLCARHWCNGFGYINLHSEGVDLECSSAPRTIKHKLHHTRHILYHISMTSFTSGSFACCSGQDYRVTIRGSYVYKCASCDFQIHSRCAFLPAKVSHKFDKHPLQLSSGTDVNGEYSFCEICEGHVDINYWFYHCEVCDQFFHVKCLPSVGLLSKIKFGGTFVIPRHREDHPVTLTRMLEIGNQRCSECERVIEGFVDAMAFECSKCCYWFHFRCAFRQGALDYWQFLSL